MAWRLANALEVLRKEVNAAHPNRPKQTDGTIGDVSHQNQGSSSDHNPWVHDASGQGVVRAWDITTANFTDALAEKLRAMGAAGDPRLVGGGMVIHKGRIASDNGGWAWRTYTGSDRHTSHIHLSVSRNQPGFDSAAPWGVAGTTPTQEEWFDMATKEELLDAVRTVFDERKFDAVANKVAAIETQVDHNQEVNATWEPIILNLPADLAAIDQMDAADVDKLAAALAVRLGDDVAKALGDRLANG